jgi:alanine dehydrogenase
VLTGVQQVEDNVAALRILEHEAEVQGKAVSAAQKYLELAIYSSAILFGTVSGVSRALILVSAILFQIRRVRTEKLRGGAHLGAWRFSFLWGARD